MSKSPQQDEQKVPPVDKRRPYQKPAIIYEGHISTRAGSPLSPDNGIDQIDLIDLLTGRRKP